MRSRSKASIVAQGVVGHEVVDDLLVSSLPPRKGPHRFWLKNLLKLLNGIGLGLFGEALCHVARYLVKQQFVLIGPMRAKPLVDGFDNGR